jgi:chromosome segregation ATPase
VSENAVPKLTTPDDLSNVYRLATAIETIRAAVLKLEERQENQHDQVTQLIEERTRLFQARFEALHERFSGAMNARQQTVDQAFAASERAIAKAETAQKEYNERSNEFRGQLDDQAQTLMPRTETAGLFKALEEKIAAVQHTAEQKIDTRQSAVDKQLDEIKADIRILRESRSQTEGKSAGFSASGALLATAIGFGLTLMGLAIGTTTLIIHFSGH